MTDKSSIKLDTTEWRKLLGEMQRNLSESKNLVARAYSIVGVADILQHFKESMGPDGIWEPLKRRKGKPLLDSGNLRNSILHSNFDSVSDDSIMVFANAPYGKQHDEGDADKHIPQRKFMWLSQKAKDRMAQVVASWITGEQ